MNRLLFLLILICSINSSYAFITVGDGGCSHDNIADGIIQAINDQDYEIRITTNKIYFENLEIEAVPISLIGGYASCNDAQSNTLGNNLTQIDGSSLFKPVIVYKDISSSANQISLKNLEVFNGLGNIINPSGGISIKDIDVQMNLENLHVHDNSSEKGGGIYSTRFDSTGDLNLLLMKDVNIDSNISIDGGGLYCTESDIYIYGDSVIQSNQALGPGGGSREGDGGGLYATANCKVHMYSGNTEFTLGIVSNTANGDGGGIYASAKAEITLDGYQQTNISRLMGNNTSPVNVTNNLTNFGDGAGVYVDGINTKVDAYATIINFNSAGGSYGGAVGVNNSAQFSMTRRVQGCWDSYLCNQIYSNKVFSTLAFPSFGGAISGQNSADIILKQIIIRNNQAENGTAFALDSSSINVSTAMIYGNGQNGMVAGLQDKSLVDIQGQANATIELSTLANNNLTETIIKNNTSFITLLASIVQDTVNVLTRIATLGEQFECLVTHEQSSFNGTSINTNLATFVDEGNGDYHLQAGSTGIDMCPSGIITTSNDIDNEIRDVLVDAGADEVNGLSDLIYISGFE